MKVAIGSGSPKASCRDRNLADICRIVHGPLFRRVTG